MERSTTPTTFPQLLTVSGVLRRLRTFGIDRTDDAVRRWERKGWLTPTIRLDSGQRLFVPGDVDRLAETLVAVDRQRHHGATR